MAQAAKKQDIEETLSPAEGLLAPYEKLAGVSAKLLPKYRKLCGERYIDLLLHLPRGILDRTYTPHVDEAEAGRLATLRVKVLRHRPTPRHVRAPYKITVEDESGQLDLIFFHAGSWLGRAFPEGEEVIVCGTIEMVKERKQMIHPDVWPGHRKLEEIACMAATYPLSLGVTRNMLALVIGRILERTRKISTDIPNWLPDDFYQKYNWPGFVEAIGQLHEVEDAGVLDPSYPARARLVFDELYAWQLALIQARKQCREKPGIAHKPAGVLRQKFMERLPFTLTGDQQQTVAEIDSDMGQSDPMLRLVQGDVGSGKTVVAFISLLRVVEGGMQGIMMAPTEILAMQHYENARKLLEPLGVSVALLTGKVKGAQKKKLKENIKSGHIDLIIGTHALIQDTVQFQRPGLVVVDEQHRFGVRQRLALFEKDATPDVLVMTATPIPRTLTLTFYGDMDISIIREKPPGRKPIETVAVPKERLGDIAESLKRVLEKNEQAYWVCPLVEESEKIDLADATARFEHLQGIYGDHVALLHGRMKGEEKENVIEAFRRGDKKILVSTTVIEVGVDVSQATVMIIEHAERFGLSQLHQLRGRVGRGDGASSCILLYYPPIGEIAQERLDTLRQSEDGFVLAEKDLELRGPGEILGTRQSGQMVTRLADLGHHKDMIPLARNMAEERLSKPITEEEAYALNWLLRLFHKENAAGLLKAG